MGARRTQTIGNVSARRSTTAVAVRRGSPDSRATSVALLISMAARLERDAQVDDERVPPGPAQRPHRHVATVTSAERTVIRTAVGTSSPMRGTRKRRLPADDTGGRDP